MADIIFPIPRRGGSIERVLCKGAARLNELGAACGSAVAVTLTENKLRRNAVAFRERDGGILLFLHPLLSTAYFEFSDRNFKRMLAHYAAGIYAIIEEMESKSGFAYCKVASLPDMTPFEYAQRDYYSVQSAIKRAVDKISQLVLRKKLTVVVDKMYSESARGVLFSRLEYALGELIAVHELYGKADDAVIEIGVTEDCLTVTLRDKISSDTAAEYYIRIFEEILKILDIGSYARLTESNELVLRAFVPFVRTSSLMCDEFAMEWENFGYIEYCLAYLNI